MSIISQSEADCNEEKERTITVKRGELGVTVEGQRGKWHGVILPKRSRGDIKGFSNSSRRRLRKFLALSRHVDGPSIKLGICLTIPGEVLPVEQVRKLWHNWVVFWKRNYPRLPLLWRIELQTRKQAHWHCVVWCPLKAYRGRHLCDFGHQTFRWTQGSRV